MSGSGAVNEPERPELAMTSTAPSHRRSPHASGTGALHFSKLPNQPVAVDAAVPQLAGHRFQVRQGLPPGSLTWLGAGAHGFEATP